MRISKNERLRIFCTGASGPYGAHFSRLALERGHEVISLRHDHKPYDSALLLGIRDKVTWVQGDIRDKKLLSEIMARYEPQAVAHFAAVPLVRTSTISVEPLFSVNVAGTVALLEAVKEQVAAKRRVHFLYVGTDKEYGDAGDTPYTEETPLLGWSAYEASKIAADVMCRSYQKHGFVPDLVVSRSCNVIAAGDTNWRLVGNSVRQCLSDVPMRVYTKGQWVREYLAVEDAVEAQLELLIRADEYRGQAFNIGSGIQKTQEEVIYHIRDTHFPKAQTMRIDPPDHHFVEIAYQRLECSKIRKTLGWKPKRTFEKAIVSVVEFWREHQSIAPWSQL